MNAHPSASSSKSNESKSSELEEVQKKVDEVTDESLQSTQRMVEYCEQAKEAGIKVIVQLDNQKEQLDRIQDGMTIMRSTLIRASENLRGMEKCCGLCPNPFKKSQVGNDSSLWRDESQGHAAASSRRTKAQRSATSAGYIGRYTNDEREELMEQNMEVVSTVLSNLKNMAIDMETELGVHSEQVKLINNMAEANNLRVNDATRRTHDLTKDN
ncbi:synaptosomal-associated protein 25-like [Folsomia candida]|uniref:Synaptosomal-associated protein 25 n=1 Tax=Folsomia candida TaxID=158441 RepID=A0A226EFH6_FOLCA|nr:synaptosomal-associated protein 25-like [Folsomia candida]OXA56393.1 Synaptosomal-associated protein 25 [Folsomia candida]